MQSKIRQLLNQSTEERHGFSDDDVELKATKTLKIDNSNSSVQVAPPLPNINENVNKILASEDEQKKIAFNLTRSFLTILKDKTLDANKDPKAREDERKIISEFANFARLLNADPNKQEEGYGTLTYVNALSRFMILQRDRINELEYEVVKLRKFIEKPQKQETKQ